VTAAISVRSLVKSYDGRVVVDHIDLDVAWGECVAVLGPNGAGKSTTIEILEGYRTRDSGGVAVCGADPATADRLWRAQIGIVLQNSQPNSELTVEELVGHFASFYPFPRDPDDVVGAVGLGEQRSKRVKVLSGGQQRRLDVALGIVGRPRVLFLDEPTTGFDPEARRQFWDLIRSLRADGTTILLTTHYLEEAAQLADRVIVLSAGRIVANSPPSTLGNRDQSPTTVSWLEDGEHRSVTTRRPTALVIELSQRFGGEVPELNVTNESLEDAYLKLIGAEA
jgi:ABC-2 type transport system ATP-binding protein